VEAAVLAAAADPAVVAVPAVAVPAAAVVVPVAGDEISKHAAVGKSCKSGS
jgi:hypothetical protein